MLCGCLENASVSWLYDDMARELTHWLSCLCSLFFRSDAEAWWLFREPILCPCLLTILKLLYYEAHCWEMWHACIAEACRAIPETTCSACIPWLCRNCSLYGLPPLSYMYSAYFSQEILHYDTIFYAVSVCLSWHATSVFRKYACLFSEMWNTTDSERNTGGPHCEVLPASGLESVSWGK